MEERREEQIKAENNEIENKCTEIQQNLRFVVQRD